MNNKLKAFLEIFSIAILGGVLMIGLKVLIPKYGEYIFWFGFLIVYLYFAYTLKVALFELQEFFKNTKNKDE